MSKRNNDVHLPGEDSVDRSKEENSSGDEMCGERRGSDVAIIGLSGRFAASANLEAFWKHLQAGECCIKEITRKGWETSTNTDSDPKRSHIPQVAWGGMLEHIDQFDPLFFNISPLEAARMDPQQRLFLEEAYKSIEDAGYSAEQLSEKKIGVFVGARSSDYKEQALRRNGTSLPSEEIDAYLFLGNDMAVLAARISYFLNCKGPSLTIDTASSSSLVAIHLACESIRSGESDMALAGGVFVMSSPEYYLMAAKTQMLAPDGKCKTFDKSANGIVIGEGVGSLLLKPVEAAIEDGDHIYGVIKASAMNQDGRTKGITAPSLLAQKALLTDLYAAIDPETVSYIEAHGTGSKLGDPIEVQALTQAFRQFTAKTQFCAIGSHKPNVGHTIASAGIAAVFKVLLALKYQQIPPTINVEEINPQIDFEESPFFVNRELRAWKCRDGSPRRAGISAFGLSGTNCHVIIEEPPPQKRTAHGQTKPAFFFPLSARTKAALSQKVGDLVTWLEKEGERFSAADISYTLVQGRSHFAVRSAVVARDTHDLLYALRELMSKGETEHDVEKDQEHPAQAEPLFHKYSEWLPQALSGNAPLDPKEYEKSLAVLADIYVKGYSLDWNQLFQGERYQRVPLPTYPFLGESYWITETVREQSTGFLKVNTGVSSSTSDLSHKGASSLPALIERLREALSYEASHLLKVPLEEFDPELPLSEYGFDSITFTEFAHCLNERYQLNLTPADLFEYSTLEQLAQYLHAAHANLLASHFAAASLTASALESDEVPSTSIAIIGMSGSFPQAPDVQSLWRNLLEGRDCISEIPPSRWDWQTYFGDPSTEANKTNIKWAGVIEDVELFDPHFFAISPREARLMDPQQRLLMMYVWKAIEDAGYSAESLSGTNTALFVGTMNSGYSERAFRRNIAIEGHSSTSLTPSVGPNRMSYFLNLHGPSEPIETACSSSLVAIHRGVTAIESGQCAMAIVGGINTLVSPELHISYHKAGMLSSDGRCKTFSAQANGYVRSEGVGILVLKKLSEAERDEDHIYGIIRGSAENHGGRATSLTAPNPRAQADLLLAAYRKAGIDPRTVGYIEAHGTGTALGDPIEINGLKTAFNELSQHRDGGAMPQAWCGIGSVKSNIGHLELAAGVAGVIKVLLQLHAKQLVKSLHCEQVNPYIQLDGSPFYIVQEHREWDAPLDSTGHVLPRRAGISSFGFGGVNAHVVLEEYVPDTLQRPAITVDALSPALIVLSARNEEQLKMQVKQLLQEITHRHLSNENLADVAYTLQVGREAMEERLAIITESIEKLREQLEQFMDGYTAIMDVYRGQVKRHKDVLAVFAVDEEIQSAIDTWVSRRKYGKLLNLWVKGLTVDWHKLYGDVKPRRMSLPTYPFAKERFWITGDETETRDYTTVVNVATPHGISLRPLSSAPTPLSLPPPESLPPLALSHVNTTLPASGRDGTSQTALPAKSGRSAQVVQRELVQSLTELLAMQAGAIDLDTNFVELGLDSILSVEWIDALNKRYGLSLPATKVYDYPTIGAFASFLLKEWEVRGDGLPPPALPANSGFSSPLPEQETTVAVAMHEVEPGIVQITMQDRINKNTFSPALVDGLIKVFEVIEANESYKVVILTGYENYFASGGTKEGLLAIQEGKAKFTDMNIYSLALDCKLPVIAAMQGHAIGAGWALGMFCDFIVMSKESYYSSNYMKYGFTPGAGATLIFPEKLGSCLAQEVLYTGKQFRGSDLATKSVAFSICPRKDVLPNALLLAQELAQAPRESLMALKELLAKSIRERVSATYDHELAMHARTFVHQPEVKERIETLFGGIAASSANKSFLQASTNKGNVRQETSLLPSSMQSTRSANPLGKSINQPHDQTSQQAIAIIGMSSQFPKAKSVAEFWDNLAQGVDCISEVPATRWPINAYYDTDPQAPGKTYSKWMGVLDDADKFDPLFFHISPGEAEWMDPQQRLFLECCWQCIEDAGLLPAALSGSRCSVFVGCFPNEYGQHIPEHLMNAQSFMGTANSILSARISYLLNLKGPTLAIDTACSSSLVAVAEACNSLVLQTSDLALAGGVYVMAGPSMHIMTCKAGMLSEDGRCFTFDRRANGFVIGEGVGVVLLKRLSDAVRDGDPIHGVIRGWGTNQDGKTNGITAPSVNSQILLEKDIYERFAISPATISLVEAHGTATKLGDPIEVEALTKAFQSASPFPIPPSAEVKQKYCALGSVKSNIGHLLAAAGIAGVIKVVLALKHQMLPPTIHFDALNEHIALDKTPFYINTQLQPWEVAPGMPRRAAVSSFGFSGTNAHLVIEEYIPAQGADSSKPFPHRPLAKSRETPCLFVLSAKSEHQLKSYAQKMVHWIQAHEEIALVDIAFTMQVGREAMEHRLAFVADSHAVLQQRLEDFVDDHTSTGLYTGQVKCSLGAGLPGYDTMLFESDEDTQSLLRSWCKEKNFEKIAQAWVKGTKIDWKILYTVEARQGQDTVPTTPALPHRINLPTYPFARERYWLPTATVGTVRDSSQGSNTSTVSEQQFRPIRTLLLTPSWKAEVHAEWEQVSLLHSSEGPPLPARSLILLCDLPETLASRIQAQMAPGGRCHSLLSSQSRRELRFQDIVVQLVQELQHLRQSRPAGQVLVQVVMAHGKEPSFFEALLAVLTVAQQEYPKLRGQLIEVDGEPEEGNLLTCLYESQYGPHEPHVRYLDGKRWVRAWQEHPAEAIPLKMPWKEGGCYLISGGNGGLARLFVQEIARQVQRATIILVGRSAPSTSQGTQIGDGDRSLASALQTPQVVGSGIYIDYQQVDVSNGPAVHSLIQSVQQRYGQLNGIIHAAGMLRTTRILDKTEEEVRAVLAPKVIGVELLDQASREISLDFFLLCSSLSAVLGGIGYVDYAAANAYLDAFAHARQALVLAGERRGITLSINWPLWVAGGMRMDALTLQTMRDMLGMEAMETQTGMSTFYQALASGQAQITVLHGQVERIKQQLLHRADPAIRTASIESVTDPSHKGRQVSGAVGVDKLREVLSRMVSDLLKVQIEQIDAETDLSEYGFDSITFTQFANWLNRTYQLDLTPAHFYEYSTLERLALYLQRTYATVLAPHFAVPVAPAFKESSSSGQAEGIAARRERAGQAEGIAARRDGSVSQDDTKERVASSAIAIIGMSGVFPQAPDVQSLWHNLEASRDCIGEIPSSRWDWRSYLGDPSTQANKTNIKWAGVVEEVELFDPQFFGISPSEAEQMDPQQRLLMMYVWKAIEDAGYSAESISGTNTALFVGTGSSGYDEQVFRANMTIEGYSVTSLAPAMGPNRMSYFLNLHGPSEAIDTACSSSLVALHRGVQAIESGECSMAIVGGVNTLVSPERHISVSKAGMLSADGRCKTFSASANGYVRGEGVGLLVLKRLSDAEAHGDHIYGVIVGSAQNHGGRASSLTAPNPRAQADLLLAAYRKAGIDPRTVSYIEAHGTGTPLGDPIEINGLKTAFSELVQSTAEGSMPQAWCGIGSLKSNIGHLEWASGIAGVIKVLLQMQHKQLAKSLHCEQVNPYIQLAGSPFYIVQQNQPWEAQRDLAGHLLPRRAGVSSFGFGGVNAHVVLEEYIPKPMATLPGSLTDASRWGQAPPLLIVLSARNEERLQEQVRQLLAWVQSEMGAQESVAQAQRLQDMAYTLQVGREAMEERLALQIGSLVELEEKLRSYLNGPREAVGWYRGQVKRHDVMGAFTADEDGQQAVMAWMRKGKYGKLLELWVKGLMINWKDLYGEHLPRRISLPTYPFAQERYWLPPPTSEPTANSRVASQEALSALHPLVQRNTSTLWEQRFSSTFRGDEFFLADHVVKGQRIMPAVAYLEMARAAVIQAIGADTSHKPSGLRLSHIQWVRPLVLSSHPATVHIVLKAQENSTIAFLISYEGSEVQGTVPTGEAGAPILVSQGSAELYTQSSSGLIASQRLDLPAVQARCHHQISASECYQSYRELSISYGPSLRGIEQLSVGEDEALARLRLPAMVPQTLRSKPADNSFVLHPSMLDSAFQACIGLLTELDEYQKPRTRLSQTIVPFALDELEIVGEMPTQGWGWVRRSTRRTTEQVFDIELCDDEGRIAVRIRGLSARILHAVDVQPTRQDAGATIAEVQSLPQVARDKPISYIPLWDPVVLSQRNSVPANSISQTVIVGGTAEEQNAIAQFYLHTHMLEVPQDMSVEHIVQRLLELGAIEQLFWLAPCELQSAQTQESMLIAQQQGVLACFRLIKALLQLGYANKTLRWAVITRQARLLHTGETGHPAHASLLGLCGSLAKEYAHWNIQLVDLPNNEPLPLAEMLRLPADPQGYGWLYRNRHWYRQILVPLDVSSLERRAAYRRGGVYVIIGGAGGIGEVWSEYLIRRYQARIIWIGRRKIDAAIEAKQQRLAALGPMPHYITADATDQSALQQAHQEVKRNFGQIHGIVHSAIVLLDQSLAAMDEQHFQTALAAKADVSVRLAQVFEHEPLDFVLFFSSFNAFICHAGQSNYAAGCTFADAFAAQLSRDWPCAVKVMNWGYWGSVGVVASSTYRERMAQSGVGSLEPAEAMEALEHLLAGPVHQMALLKMTKLQASREMIQPEEMVMVYPDGLPSYIHSLQKANFDQYVRFKSIDAATRQGIQEMDELLGRLLWSYLQSLGLFREKYIVRANLREQAGISANYDRWLQESIVLLERQHYLDCQQAAGERATCTVVDPTLIESAPVWQQWDQHKVRWVQNANLKAQVVLVETMLHAMSAILTGKRPATEIMFPDGSLQLVEEVYRHHVIADSFNEVLARFLSSYLRERLAHDRHAPIRILEIGAGTGGTASLVLPMLQPYQASIAEYCYSDISDVFLRHGQRMYGTEYPYLTYRLVNVEKPLTSQGITPGSYDLVIATNVLHATSNIRRTVRNTKAALKKHGLLLLNEITNTSLFMHLTFGLLEGWWIYEDPELRVPGCPALSAENWQAVLSSEGFGEIYFPVRDTARGLATQMVGQQAIIAESNGVVRQPPVRVAGQEKGSQALDLRRAVLPSTMPAPSSTAPERASVRSIGASQAAAQGMHPITDKMLREKTITYLKGQVAKVLSLPSAKIDATEPLSNYGLDSLLVLKLTNVLRTEVLQVDSTLFFEYATIEALVEHLLHTQKDVLKRLVGLSVPVHEQAPLRQLAPEGDNIDVRLLTREQIGSEKDGGEVEMVATRQERATVPTASASREAATALPAERDIAIIGLVGRYPGAKDVQTFWHLLKAGESGIREIPAERWDWRLYSQGEKSATRAMTEGIETTVCPKWGGFLEDIECFDASFFHVSPREAEQIDPQERLFLEASYACIEDAGYTTAGLRELGPVGVFVGVMNSNYPTGVKHWSIANRVSFALGLQGPSLAVDTACSSSLTALHIAVESLICGTSASALVGGVNLIVDPVHYMRLSKMGMLSTSDQCKSFGEDADGFVDAEGVGAILLKPLARAEADGDHIYGVIKATAINHGGKTNGYTVPNPQGQAEVIEQALQRAAIDPRTITYLEAHGTGTRLGDPIEIAGLTRAFAQRMQAMGKSTVQDTQATGWCAIGSVKSNIGHTESAAGIAGITKVLLQMRYGQLVPSLHAQALNPHIDFGATPFVVQQELREWKRPQAQRTSERQEVKRRAGVSSFGAGGSNAHVILEEYVCSHRTCPNAGRKARPALIVLSARSEERLHEHVEHLLTWIQSSPWADADIAGGRVQAPQVEDLAYTLQVGREAMEERLALQVTSLAELEEKLRRYLQDPQEAGDWYRGQAREYKNMVALLSADDALQEVTSKWLKHGQYEKLLEGWTKGLAINWKDLYGEYLPRRISLPTYPFARQRYWFSSGASLPATSISESAVSSTATGPITGPLPSSVSKSAVSSTATGPITGPLPSSHGISPLSITQHVLEPVTAIKTHDQASDKSMRVALRSLADNSGLSNGLAAKKPIPNSGLSNGLASKLTTTVSQIEDELARSLAQALYMELHEIDTEKPFIDMGLDSIIGVEWVECINKQYAIHLKASTVYDYPTIRQLAGFLQKDLSRCEVEIPQTPAESMPAFALDDVLHQVQQGSMELKEADQLLQQFFL